MRPRFATRLLVTTSALALAFALAPAPPGVDLGPIGAAAAHADECCFTSDTSVLMTDGSSRRIDEVAPGDLVMGRDGRTNAVRAVRRVRLGARALHGVNGMAPFFTAEHPFLTPRGWAALDSDAGRREAPGLALSRLAVGDILVTASPTCALSDGTSALVARVALGRAQIVMLGREWRAPGTWVFNLTLDGDHTYVANGFVVHNKDGGDGSDGGSDDGSGGGSDDGSNDGGGSGEVDSDDHSGPGGGEAGETEDDHSGAGEAGERGASGGDGPSDELLFKGDVTPEGDDLTPEEERALIERGWE